MGTRWDGKIGKIPKISDKRETKRFSPRLTGGEPDFHECRSTPEPGEETNSGNGRKANEPQLFSPETVSQYKSQWARYQKALSLNPAAIVQSGDQYIYKFESCDSITGFWEVSVEEIIEYFLNAPASLTVLCPIPFRITDVESNAVNFIWRQLSGRAVVISPEDAIDPEILILDDIRSREPILLEVAVAEDTSIKDELIIYTTPTDNITGLSCDGGRGIINAPLECHLLKTTIAQAPLPIALELGYFYECSATPKRCLGWSNPECDVDKLVEFVFQKTSPTQPYFDVQRFFVNDRRLFVAEVNTQYRILAVFQLPNDSKIISKTYFSLSQSNSLLLADDTFHNRNSRFFPTDNEKIFHIPRWTTYKLERLPLDHQVFNCTDILNSIAKEFITNLSEQAAEGAQIPVSNGDGDIDTFAWAFKIETAYTITRLNLGGVIIG